MKKVLPKFLTENRQSRLAQYLPIPNRQGQINPSTYLLIIVIFCSGFLAVPMES
jgi:hypothetical protein